MTLKEINYQPLQPFTTVSSDIIKSIFRTTSGWIVLFVLFLSIFLAISIDFELLVVGFMIISVYYSKKLYDIRSRAWRQFAKANNWRLIPALAFSRWFIPPSLANQGHSGKYSDVIEAQFEDHLCNLYLYEYTTGSGKSSKTYYFTVAEVMLEKSFPHIILDSKSISAIRELPHNYQKISLEGNFDKYFSLHIQKNEHIDALSVITPDIMQTLISNNTRQDVEIFDTSLYFISASDQRGPSDIGLLLKSVDALADEIVHKAQTINYQTVHPKYANKIARYAAASFAGANNIANHLSLIMLFILLLPVIMFILMGAFIQFAGG